MCLNHLVSLKSMRISPCSLLQASAAQEMRDKEAQVGGSKDHLAVFSSLGLSAGAGVGAGIVI